MTSHSEAPVCIGTMDAARYLLLTKSPEQFHIELKNDDTIQNYILHLSDENKWSGYKKYIHAEIKKIKKEIADLDSTQATQIQKQLAQLILQEKNTQQIDALTQDGKLQESLISHDVRSSALFASMDEIIHQSMNDIEKLQAMDYSLALYRDGYILHQANKHIEKVKKEMDRIDGELIQIKEIIISNYLNQAQLTENETALKIVQNAINKARTELMDETLQRDITELCFERNEMILQHPVLYQSMMTKFYSDPHFAWLSLQKMNLADLLNQIIKARWQVRQKFIISIFFCIAMGLGFIAIFVRGLGELVLVMTGIALLCGVTIAGLSIFYQEKKKKTQVPVAIMDTLHEDYKKNYSSELQMDRNLLNGKQQDIARVLTRRK